MLDVEHGDIVEGDDVEGFIHTDGDLLGRLADGIIQAIPIKVLCGLGNGLAKGGRLGFGVNNVLIGGAVDMTNGISVVVAGIVQLQLQTGSGKRCAGGLIRSHTVDGGILKGEAGDVLDVFLIIGADIALVETLGIEVIAGTVNVLDVVGIVDNGVLLVLRIPEGDDIFAVFGHNQGLLILIGHIAGDGQGLFGDHGLAVVVDDLLITQGLIGGLVEILHRVGHDPRILIIEGNLVGTIGRHGEGLAYGIGIEARAIVRIQVRIALGIEGLGIAHQGGAGGVVRDLRHAIRGQDIMDGVSLQDRGAPLGVEVQVPGDGHGEVEGVLHAVLVLVEPADKLQIRLGQRRLRGLRAVRNRLGIAQLLVVVHGLLVEVGFDGVGLGGPLGVEDGVVVRHRGVVPIHCNRAAGIRVPAVKGVGVFFQTAGILRHKPVFSQRLFVGDLFALYNRTVVVEVQIVAVAAIINIIIISEIVSIGTITGEAGNLNVIFLSEIPSANANRQIGTNTVCCIHLIVMNGTATARSLTIDHEIPIGHIRRCSVERATILRRIPQVSAGCLAPPGGGIRTVLDILKLGLRLPVREPFSFVHLKRQRVRVALVVDVDHGGAVALDLDILVRSVKVEACVALIVGAADFGTRRGSLLHRSVVAVAVIVGIFQPVLNQVSGLTSGPVGRIGGVLGGHGGGQGEGRRPGGEGVACTHRGAHRGDGGAVAGVDRLHAVAAVHGEVHEVVVAVVVNLHHGATVGGNLDVLIGERIEAVIRLGQGGADVIVCLAGPLLGFGLGVVVVVHVLLIVHNGEVDDGRSVGHRDRGVFVDGLVEGDLSLGRRVAHHCGAGNRHVQGVTLFHRGRPGVGGLLALVICKHVVDDDIIRVLLVLALGEGWQGHQRQGHDQRQHECQRPFPCFHFLIPPISFILGAGRPQLTWVLQGQFWMMSIVHHSDIVCKRFWDLFAIFLRRLALYHKGMSNASVFWGYRGGRRGAGVV